ncbi:STAS domain-containing protein [Lusitaniella coriacea LEGE 07157]|uniref:STAS domain-containing protein n=1 Tax=Lusitaniella coriacea LEGE 07157 TaxID=945747 RepID=A0A8J7DXS3_9CYAN|nr:STAS domain-containing protein [Lusitaniella coriacea]MBE9116990.1 STAS domain-containing protein [Lusitaniella coriacea LEGE 07157]
MNIVLRPQRDLDIKGASILQQKVFGLLPVQEESCWVIDMVQVNFINHFGLTSLIAVRQAARQYGCRLYLLNLKQPVLFMLEITGLDKEFEILESLDAAFNSKIRLLLC